MIIASKVLAWIAFAAAIVLLFKFAARKSGIRFLNKGFSVTHKPVSVLLLCAAVPHAVMSLIRYQCARRLPANVSGIIMTAAVAALFVTYILRKRIKGRWMLLHRVFSVIFSLLLILHIVFAFVRWH